MRLEVCTLALDAMPWITHHLPILNALPGSIDWRWTIAHGVSCNVNDTAWMAYQKPRLSTDGTTEYLAGLAAQHPRVRVLTKLLWLGKTAQINACLEGAQAPAVILQMDADEVWATKWIEKVVEVFGARPDIMRMQFRCAYFLGPNIIASRDGAYGCRQEEWMRAWRMTDSSHRFLTHEPPNFAGNTGRMMGRDETAAYQMGFSHYAYATEKQVAYKEVTYKYPGAVAGWRRLQANRVWPTRLKPFMGWVDDLAEADLWVR